MKDIIVRLRTKGEINLDNESSSINESSLDSDLKYETPISSTEYNEESIKIATYLITLKKLKGMSALEFRRFKREALKYKVYRRKLWRLLMKGMPIKLIVNKEEMRAQILRDVYNQSGHKGRESTYYRLL
jgi:hypothetical protein